MSGGTPRLAARISRVPALLSLALFLACGGGEGTGDAGRGDGSGGAPGGASARGPDAVKKVLIIGIDGVRPDVLAEVDTPAIDALVADGAFSDRAVTTTPTVSGPAWSSMLTGVWPGKHGVVSNDFSTNDYETYPSLFTWIERARPSLHTFAVADWRPLVAEEDGGPLIADVVDQKVVLDGHAQGWMEADSIGVGWALDQLKLGDPDAMFVYLGNPDETSHRTGAIGPEYRAAIARADREVERLVSTLRSRPSYSGEDWLILVGTDHGRRADGGHGGDTPEEETIFYVASGPSAVKGEIPEPPRVVDVAVTAMAHLGIEPRPEWGLDGRAVGIRR